MGILPALTFDQIKERYLQKAREIYQDTYVKSREFTFQSPGNKID